MTEIHSAGDRIFCRISEELSLPEKGVKQTVSLIDEGNTVPFIARYRQEMTGGLTDEEIFLIQEKLVFHRGLEEKRDEILRLIEALDALTPMLKKQIMEANTITELNDLYRPYRPKRKTRASEAKDRGLEPLALAVLEGNVDALSGATSYVDLEKKLPDIKSVIQGVADIIAEKISDDSSVRKNVRQIYHKEGLVIADRKNEAETHTYDHYTGFKEPVASIKSHRVLAINRGVKEKALNLKILIEPEQAYKEINKIYVNDQINQSCRDIIVAAGEDSYQRLLHPALERETWQNLLKEAMEGAVLVFKENLRKRLLVPPVRDRRVMGWDPGFRTGCKLACVSESGVLLEVATIYPTAPKNDLEGARVKVLELLSKHGIDCIALGNGTASRESEEFIAGLIKNDRPGLEYTVVNEAGASVYSASPIARLEFPDLGVEERSAASIARRLQDPLAELVKISPRALGLGQYQHDLPVKELDSALQGTVESCVNTVGVDLNSASQTLLVFIAGINKTVAGAIIAYREKQGRIRSREELLSVSGLGPKIFKQCAGFLRIPDSDYYLDRTAVHPESYGLASRIMQKLEVVPESLGNKGAIPLLDTGELTALAENLDAGIPTIRDILEEFRRPGRDPREELPRPVFMSSLTSLEDLQPGMILQGIVRNIVDFGAFVDLGVHHDGLVHISEIADRYIKHPLDALSVEEVVKVKILSIDRERKRISLSVKAAAKES